LPNEPKVANRNDDDDDDDESFAILGANCLYISYSGLPAPPPKKSEGWAPIIVSAARALRTLVIRHDESACFQMASRRLSRFCTARQIQRQTHRPRYVDMCNNMPRLHMAMRFKNVFQNVGLRNLCWAVRKLMKGRKYLTINRKTILSLTSDQLTQVTYNVLRFLFGISRAIFKESNNKNNQSISVFV